jgi:ribosomal protein S4
MIKFFSYFKKKKFFLQYRFKKCFSPIRRSFWIKTKYFFQKLALSTYSNLIYFKKSSKLLMTRRQLFYILKVAANTEVLQDPDYAKRKVFSLRKFNVRYKKNSLKKFLFLKNFSKKIYLYSKFFKYLKILRKIKNQFFFKKKKFIEIFFLRLDIFLSETKFLGPLKTVRQLIELNYIHLNLKVETKPNSVLKLLDIINVCKKANS